MSTQQVAPIPRVSVRTTCSLPAQLQPPPSESSDSSTDDDGDIIPPEIVDAPTAKLLDALGLMLRSRYCDERRHHPNLQLPLELLEGSDIQWIVKGHRDHSPSKPSAPGHHGKKNIPDFVANHFQYTDHGSRGGDGDHAVVIDSPRSLVVLLANGYSAASLMPVTGDEITSQRRHRALGLLIPAYHEQCRKVSSHFVGDVLRGAVDVWEHVAGSGPTTPIASPRNTSPSTTPNRTLSMTKAHALPKLVDRRTKPQDLARLQRIRTNFTIEWGMRQQNLAEETFHVSRVAAVVEQRKSRASTSMSVSRQEHSSPTTTTPSPRRTTPNSVASPVSPSRPPSEATTRPVSVLSKKSIPNHVEYVKAESKRIEEERRKAAEHALAQKARAAEAAVERRARERQEKNKAQKARGREVHDVVERMSRAEAVKRMMVVKHMEEDTETKLAWQQQQRAVIDNLRYQHKQRAALQHRTRQLVEQATIAVSKATSLQEMAVTSPVDVQRALKAESRQILVRYLRREDELINQWSKFETQQ